MRAETDGEKKALDETPFRFFLGSPCPPISTANTIPSENSYPNDGDLIAKCEHCEDPGRLNVQSRAREGCPYSGHKAHT